jgi:hypothetical protein
MRSSDRRRLAPALALVASLAWTTGARAQQQPQGFAVERFYPSAPGAGWFVMDALDMRGGLGGVMGLTLGYARDPLRMTTSDGSQRLAVVSDQLLADFGFAATYGRMRAYLNLDMPVYANGQGGTIGSYQFTAPDIDPSSHPDTLADARLGFDARLVGEADGPFRLGGGAQVLLPNGNDRCYVDTVGIRRCDYDTDGTLRAMVRVLVAGDLGQLTYAGHLGIHLRSLDESSTPGSPQGSELLFGAAGGARLPLPSRGAALVVGPEIFGASALGSLFGTPTTALEALLSGRVEGTGDDGAQLRVKLGTGAGLNPHFGAPEWRLVLGVEVFARRGERP